MNALSTLEPIAAGLWSISDHLRAPGGVRLPVRATVVRLSDGDLLVHAPTPLRDGVAEAVTALGPVRHLVAPSLMHHLWLGEWATRFPEAAAWGAAGLPARRTDVRFTGTLDAQSAPPPWSADLKPLPLAGCPLLAEVVFLHRTSATLLCTDLLFNVRRPDGWATRLALTMMGTNGRLGMSRAWRIYRKDRRAFRESLEQMLRWNFQRLVPGHGDVFTAGQETQAQTRAALAWALRA